MKNEIKSCVDVHFARQQAALKNEEAKEWQARVAELCLPRTGDVGFDPDYKLWFVIVVDDGRVRKFWQPNMLQLDSGGTSTKKCVSFPIDNANAIEETSKMISYNLFDRMGLAFR